MSPTRNGRQSTFAGARSVTVEYPNGDRVLWTREIPSNTWRGRVVAVQGDPRPDADPFISGFEASQLLDVLTTATEEK